MAQESQKEIDGILPKSQGMVMKIYRDLSEVLER